MARIFLWIDPADRDFIDRLARRNDEPLDAGTIKPTMMFADMMRKGTQDAQTKIVWQTQPAILRALSGLSGRPVAQANRLSRLLRNSSVGRRAISFRYCGR